MRIPSPRRWLLTAGTMSLLAAPTTAEDLSVTVDFTGAEAENTTLFHAEPNVPRVFRVRSNRIGSFLGVDIAKYVEGATGEIVSSFSRNTGSPISQVGAYGLKLDFPQTSSNTLPIVSAVITEPYNLSRNVEEPHGSGKPGQLHFRFHFLQSGSVSEQTVPSGKFGFSTLPIGSEEFKRYGKEIFSVATENDPLGTGSAGGGGPVIVSGSSTATTSPTPTSLIIDETQTPGTTGTATAATSGPNGLSTGTIAGVAVGAAVIALIVLGALAWLLLRRRRRSIEAKKAGGIVGGYGAAAHPGPEDIMAEKDANAAAAESPHSPYSDDGHQRDSALLGGGGGSGLVVAAGGAAGLMAHHHHQDAADFPPYSDHPSRAPAAATGAAAVTAATATPRSAAAVPASVRSGSVAGDSIAGSGHAGVDQSQQQRGAALPPRAGTGMSGRYAHLVEDGMTQDEIARMEAEERELDAAIAQARGTTTS